jgi:CRISPR-associated protein Csx14
MCARVIKGEVVAVANAPWNFWSGQQTSLRIWTSLRQAILVQLKKAGALCTERLFESRMPLSGRFGFDPGAAWNALDVGFSPNEHNIDVASSPAVELLAAVGLQRHRPRLSADRASFTYSTWGQPLDPRLAAVAVAGALPTARTSRFLGRVVSRGSYAALGHSTSLTGAAND